MKWVVEIKGKRQEVNLSEVSDDEKIAEMIYVNLYNWKRECERLSESEAININWLPIMSFILGTVTTGFLKQIGSEIWQSLKNIFFSSNCEEKTPNFEFRFNYQGIKVVAEVNSNDVQTIRSALNNLENILKELEEKETLDKMEFVWSPQENWRIKRSS